MPHPKSLFVLALVHLAACTVEPDGHFDPGQGPPSITGASAGADESSTGSESDSGESTGAVASESTGDAADSSTGGEETGVDHDSCPEAVGPGVYECPAYAEFSSHGSRAFCLYEGIALPDASGLFAYCNYLELGYLGFGWDLGTESPGYICPAGSRYAPNATVGYCLWEDIELPAGAAAQCSELLVGTLGFSWPCP